MRGLLLDRKDSSDGERDDADDVGELPAIGSPALATWAPRTHLQVAMRLWMEQCHIHSPGLYCDWLHGIATFGKVFCTPIKVLRAGWFPRRV